MDPTLRSGLGEVPQPGEVVSGKYRIESVVGQGGMGVVMGATDLQLNRAVAIKFLAPDRAFREGAVARFTREARAAAAIQSENVVRVFDVSTLPNGAPYIVMEHLRGADLSHYLASRGPLGIDEACDYILQTCEALGEAHGRGIVHRDLKPQNLFLTHRPDGTPLVKVLDFGISKAVEEGAPNLTATDTVMGTPLYMSPEQVRSLKNLDQRADIWALGSILFELLTNAPIYQAPSASALCAMIAMDPPTMLRALKPEHPPTLEALILRCLHKDPAGRFQDVAALAEALGPFASERGRLSVAKVFAVVRGSAPPALGSSPMVTGGMAMTGGSGGPTSTGAFGGYNTGQFTGTGPTMAGTNPPAPMPTFGGLPNQPPLFSVHPSAPPQQPTTQSNWQHQTAGQAAPPKKSGNGVLIALLGVTSALVLVAVIGGGAYVYSQRDKDLNAATSAATAPPIAAATTAAPIGSATAAATTTDKKPGATTAATPITTVKRDAGAAPSTQKDGGGANSDPEKEEAERNAALGRAAENNCRNHNQQMTTFARDDASRKRAAEQAKLFTCKGQTSSRCERQTCMNACMILNDQPCIQQMQFVIDHGAPAKF